MTDTATPNLPSRDFDATLQFYRSLGFEPTWRDAGWMILRNGGMVLEFFPHPQLDPATSWFSCCFRLGDVDAFIRALADAGIPETSSGWPRFHRPVPQAWGGRVGALIDLDGSLIRLVQAPVGDR